jgi:precorrin-4 methylase
MVTRVKKIIGRFFLMMFVLCIFSNSYASEKGKLYVVGMGPAGPDLTSPRALAIIEKADVLLCSPRIPARFEMFGNKIDPQKVAFDPWEGLFGEKMSELKKTNYQEWLATTGQHIKKVQNFVMQKIGEGKTVAMIDGGDPCIYGPSLSYLLKGFDESLFEVIPGLSAFNAAGAALKRSMTPEDVRFVVLTSPESLFGESWEKGDEILKDLSKYETTMVFFMSLKSLNKLVDQLKKYYAPALPIAVVYYAGYMDKEQVLRSKLGSILEDIKKMDEKWLGLVVIGKPAG